MITGRYRQNIFEQSGGEYWKDLFCWPTHVVEHNGKLGLWCPPTKIIFSLSTVLKTMISWHKRPRERR